MPILKLITFLCWDLTRLTDTGMVGLDGCQPVNCTSRQVCRYARNAWSQFAATILIVGPWERVHCDRLAEAVIFIYLFFCSVEIDGSAAKNMCAKTRDLKLRPKYWSYDNGPITQLRPARRAGHFHILCFFCSVKIDRSAAKDIYMIRCIL